MPELPPLLRPSKINTRLSPTPACSPPPLAPRASSDQRQWSSGSTSASSSSTSERDSDYVASSAEDSSAEDSSAEDSSAEDSSANTEVQSFRDPSISYTVNLSKGTCTCADFRFRALSRPCKHISQMRGHATSPKAET